MSIAFSCSSEKPAVLLALPRYTYYCPERQLTEGLLREGGGAWLDPALCLPHGLSHSRMNKGIPEGFLQSAHPLTPGLTQYD